MHITVFFTDGTSDDFPTLEYQTSEGELDILEDGIVVVTFPKDSWKYVARVKNKLENWPKWLLDQKEPVPATEQSLIRGDEDAGIQTPEPTARDKMLSYMKNPLLE